MGDWPDSWESDGGISSSLSWVRGAALRRMGHSTSLRDLHPPSIQGSALKRRDSFLQEEEGKHSLSSLSSLDSTARMEERRGSTDTFTVNLLPASNPKFFLPPIDSDLAASSSSAVKKMRKISKVRFKQALSRCLLWQYSNFR